MTDGYVRTIAQAAYVWAWPMVNMHNRRVAFSQVPEPGLMGGVMPCGPLNEIAMLTDYITPDQKFVACPNQDVVYGFGILSLDLEPAVVQVPEMGGDRFWVYQIADQRTDAFGGLGKQYGTEPGHYLVVGPDWNGDVPDGIAGVLHSPTNLACCIPRLFLDDTDEDRAAVQPLLSQISVYPVSRYDGTMKIKDWHAIPEFPGQDTGGEEIRWVDPATFFESLPTVLDDVPPLPGEEALYAAVRAILAAAEADPHVKELLDEVASETERDVVHPLFHWSNVGLPVGAGWTSPKTSAEFGTDYYARLSVARTNIFVNLPTETTYFYNQADDTGADLHGDHAYTVTFPAGGLPPVQGFWSLTLYNEHHFFATNDLVRYSLGTKNADLEHSEDGSLTLHVQATPPAEAPHANWLPAPAGQPFSLYLRTYWPAEAVLAGEWVPPTIARSDR
ncbi:DUF1254 domain-containing protein [Aquihabitans sp. McL0605]|uniref:DUF1254 domain-containing protein n=1 Tax=Aquihabitans sp. McL0605 TaxID=3415671 RepID=UPI003CE69DAA